jgi:hypothetical protein
MLADDLESLIAPETCGDPVSPLLCVRKLAEQLSAMGPTICHHVTELLYELGDSLQAAVTARSGG